MPNELAAHRGSRSSAGKPVVNHSTVLRPGNCRIRFSNLLEAAQGAADGAEGESELRLPLLLEVCHHHGVFAGPAVE